jgi:hypothetical protein
LLFELPLRNDTTIERSGAAAWPLLRQFIAAEARVGAAMSGHPARAALYEFFRFGMKQAWACLFGGMMVSLLIATYLFYPHGSALARYDFLFLAALSLQVLLLGLRLETFEEAKVIATYHVVGTVMEIFKTTVGSWSIRRNASFALPQCRSFRASCTRASAATCAARGRCSTSSSRRTRRPPGWSS